MLRSLDMEKIEAVLSGFPCVCEPRAVCAKVHKISHRYENGKLSQDLISTTMPVVMGMPLSLVGLHFQCKWVIFLTLLAVKVHMEAIESHNG